MNRSTQVLTADSDIRVALNRGNAVLVEVVGDGWTGTVDLKSSINGTDYENHPYIQPRAPSPGRSVAQITSGTRTLCLILPPVIDAKIVTTTSAGTLTV